MGLLAAVLAQTCPGMTVVSITHRQSVARLHANIIDLTPFAVVREDILSADASPEP
ncbi:hypothetical protein [Acetobacter aceti]|uniref:Uncharacterized protein n=1 Tax=Acetobacter aceti TaxID=435 RepID=A0A6S6PJZ3_ACEAC|nr:hypothetical protein [Acetobacter aceti]BCI68158.1 hypothetical protein AAJCM20276_27820 [Acetobacter aceti]